MLYIQTNMISLISYWGKVINDETYFKLTLILSMDVYNLNQGGSLTLLPVSSTQEERSSQGTGDAGPESEEVDLSDYLIAKIESD